MPHPLLVWFASVERLRPDQGIEAAFCRLGARPELFLIYYFRASLISRRGGLETTSLPMGIKAQPSRPTTSFDKAYSSARDKMRRGFAHPLEPGSTPNVAPN